MKKILLYFAIKYNGDWDKIYEALEKHEDYNADLIDSYYEEYKGKFLTIFDDEYPSNLKKILRPPFVLFYEGNLKLLSDSSKLIWPYGSISNDVVNSKINELNQNKISVVTGYTNEIEKKILDSANAKNSVVVKDSGIKSTLVLSKPQANKIVKAGGLIITEYPDYVIPTLKTWRESNKIKIGLSQGMFLINSFKEKNLFMMIAETIEEGKDVYCLELKKVEQEDNDHNDTLIEKGAQRIKKIQDLAKSLRD